MICRTSKLQIKIEHFQFEAKNVMLHRYRSIISHYVYVINKMKSLYNLFVCIYIYIHYKKLTKIKNKNLLIF